jgi:TetR/AcrR family transcriptional regulator, repressor for uid operon
LRACRSPVLHPATHRGAIRPYTDFDAVVTMIMVFADGVWWRRAVDPAFDAEAVLPIFMDLTRHMLLGAPGNENESKEAQS